MDYDKLQEAFKSDLLTIPTLKMGILSAGELYGSLGLFILKLSLIFCGLDTLYQALLHAVGLYYWTFSFSKLLVTFGFALISSGLICLFVSQFVLFGKLVKGRLKTEAFIKEKCLQCCWLYFVIYSVLYLIILTYVDSSLGSSQSTRDFFGSDQMTFDLAFSQFSASMASFVFTGLFVNMEISRLGMGIAFDVIDVFVTRMNPNHSISTQPENKDVDDAR